MNCGDLSTAEARALAEPHAAHARFMGLFMLRNIQHCWNESTTALPASGSARKNQAMLDKESTAATLKAQLAAAFEAWRQEPDPDGLKRGKTELARRCQALAERPCTAQTVGEWFRTGRMDKGWVPVIEKVLGRPINPGFGSEKVSGESKPEKPALAIVQSAGTPAGAWPFTPALRAKLDVLTPMGIVMVEGAILEAIAHAVAAGYTKRPRARRSAPNATRG